MNFHSAAPATDDRDGYLVSKPKAWFAFAMTFALMLFDYIDRQVIVSLFPHLKAAWGLSDMQLGGLVSIISIVVAVGGLPVALLADRYGRVKSIVVMAAVWSLATISCMFTRNYSQFFLARAIVGVGETGYGSVGGALIASLFPKRLRATLLGAFLAAASIGSVLGVMIGGTIAARWGWEAAFGVVGIPGLILALLYLLVPDYKTVDIASPAAQGSHLAKRFVRQAVASLVGSPTMWWTCVGAACQLVVVSTIWAWLPSYFNRYHGAAPDKAAMLAAVIVLCGAAGSFLWGVAADAVAVRRAPPAQQACADGNAARVHRRFRHRDGCQQSVSACRLGRPDDDVHDRARLKRGAQRHSSRASLHRRGDAVAVPEPARPRRGAIRGRPSVRCVGPANGDGGHACLRRACRAVLFARDAHV